MVVSFNGIQIAISLDEPDFSTTGPYIDALHFEVVPNQDLRVLKVQDGSIDMDYEYFDPVHLNTLTEDPDISLFETLRNGYSQIFINCAKYPLNISGLRRAFAFAYDKQKQRTDVMDGFSKDQDSLVPYCSQWCIEDELPWHYYDYRPDIGNAILDSLGFNIDNETGYRNAPNGGPFQIVIEYVACSCILPGATAEIGVDGLEALHINATRRAGGYTDFMYRIDNHGDWDMVFLGSAFTNDDVRWLAYEYWSDYANTTGENPTGFQNATYDSWRNQLLHGITHEEVFEAAAEMQKILHYNVPLLVVAQNIFLSTYRDDKFTGQVGIKSGNMANQWTFRDMHRIGYTTGGTAKVSVKDPLTSFNPFMPEQTGTNYYYGRDDDQVILDTIYSSLYDIGPNGDPYPDLVQSFTQETHEDNPAIPEGYIRFTFDIVENATWSDGIPLTAEDIVFTFTYMMNHDIPSTPFNEDWIYSDINAIWSLTPYRAVFEFTSEDYWNLNTIAFEYILPMHILSNDESMDYLDWNPIYNETQPLVTSGPFLFSRIENSEYESPIYQFSYNPDFYYAPDRSVVETETSTPSITTNSTIEGGIYWSTIINASIISASGIVIVFCIIIIIKRRGNVVG